MQLNSFTPVLRASLLSGASLLAIVSVSNQAQAVVARDDQAAAIPVTYTCVPGPGGGSTTVTATAGTLADTCNGLTYVAYTVTDLTPPPFNAPGFVGQCTGTLINPRMILTAAHCYNDAPETAYGVGGTVRHAVNFSPLPLANNSLANWLFGTPLLNGQTSNGYVDIASVRYAPGNIDFLQGDIAIVTLTTPVTNVGFSPILMSPLDQRRDAIVNGYGLTGAGTTGATISSRVRRTGQNNVGASLSIDDLCLQVFGLDPISCLGGSLPQNLYWSDFDSLTVAPGTRQNGFDFDVLPGPSLPREAMTGGGDSGSSLFVTIAGRQVSLGPLSGSFRFFGAAQPFGSYGTTSFYQPAYLYANWIASVNPTRYYVAKAGNFTWNSAATWDEFLDPNFLVLSGGNLVNGLPATDAGAGPTTDLGFFNDGSLAPADSTGGATITGSGNIVSLAGLDRVSSPAVTNDLLGDNDYVQLPATALAPDPEAGILSPSALNPGQAPGAPRAPGTVGLTPVAAFPNNINGTNTINGRYFDVTLRNAGTVTLSGLSPTIDRLTINGASAGLQINAGSTLTSLISPELWAGTLRVDGNLSSALNIWQLGGRLQGIGSLTTPAAGGVLSIGGVVAPGNSIGTLTVNGDYFLGSGALLEIELTNGASDVLAVTGNALIAGSVRFQPFGPAPLNGQVYTFLTTGGALAGTFSSIQDSLPGGLFPIVSYGPNFARVTIRDMCFFASGEIETPVCQALSDNAVATDPDMIGPIGRLQALASTSDPSQLGVAFESLNPTRVHAQALVGLQTGDLLRNQFGRRTHDLMGGASNANVAQRDLASAQLASAMPSADMLASAATAALDATEGGGSNLDLPNGYAMFFAADVALADTDQPGGIGTDESDVAALTAGLDYAAGDGLIYGGALSFLQSNVSQEYGLGGRTSSDGLAASAYGNLHRGLLYVDGYLSYAMHDFETKRFVLLGPGGLTEANGETDASQIQGGATLGYGLNTDARASIGAVAGLYYVNLDIDGYTETGAGALSAVIPSRTIDSLKGQIGGEASFQLEPGNETLVPILRVVWNHEFMDDALLIRSAFAGAPATTFATPGPELGTDWATVGVGLSGRVGGTSFYFRYQHDFGRDGQDNQEVSAAARMAF